MTLAWWHTHCSVVRLVFRRESVIPLPGKRASLVFTWIVTSCQTSHQCSPDVINHTVTHTLGTSLSTSVNWEEVSMSRACNSNTHSACASAILWSLLETSLFSSASWLWSSTRCSFSDLSSVVSSGCISLCLIIWAASSSETRKSKGLKGI